LLDKDHSAPSSNKYPEATDFVSTLIDIPSNRVYITYIGKAANFGVRILQSMAAVRASVIICLIKLRTEDEATHRAARKFAAWTGKPLFLLQTASDGSKKWEVMGGYYPGVDPQSRDLMGKLNCAFPGPTAEPIEMSPQHAATEALSYFQRIGLTGAGIGSTLSEWHGMQSLFSVAASSSDAGLSAAEVAIVSKRRDLIAELKELINNPDTNERALHKKIADNYWIFGGRYTGVADRKSLIPMDEYDIPLFCADGSLHIVELKGSCITDLVRRHRKHLIVGPGIHKATGQAANYIRQLDEGGATMETLYKKSGIDYDFRRARATVVIGNPDFVTIPADEKQNLGAVDRPMIDQTIRTYNSLINRVEVTTWNDLLDAADRSLRFEEEIADNRPAKGSATSVVDEVVTEEVDSTDEGTIF
jgi:hypothetical protein